MSAAPGRAYARAALLGNPSDGYGGRTIAFAMPNFAAEVTVEESRRTDIEPGPAEPLLAATVKRFHDHLKARGDAAAPAALRIRWRTSIPREVGLGGSSAIVIVALRALCALHDTSIPAESLPSLALSVETRSSGSRYAGPGGAIAALPREPEQLGSIRAALEDEGGDVVVPRIAR